jgi:hypothetical protein
VLAIDHVILVVTDLEDAAAELFRRHGLASVPGGRHQGHGTANRIVPLGDTYLELMGCVDEAEAATSPMGRWVLRHRDLDLIPRAVCLRTDDIDGVASALGEVPLAMHRVRTDGVRLPWRLAGLEGMLGPQGLPFFIQWEVSPGDHPGAMAAPHRVSPLGIARVTIGTVPARLSRLMAPLAGLQTVPGRPGVHSVDIQTNQGTITLPG